MHRGTLEGGPLVEGEAKRLEVKYVTTSGAKMENCGQKRIRFKKEGLGGISDMVQVTIVSVSWVWSRASCKMCYTVAFLHQLGDVLHRLWCCCCTRVLITVVDGQLNSI